MRTEIQVHPIQADILMYLLFNKDARFSEININKIETDSFVFHLKSLVNAGLIEKIENKYSLTIKGKEYANRFDTEKVKIEKQAKLGVCIVCSRRVNGQTEYLMQQRLKQPFFGYYGFITGKISWGETTYQTAARELKEETNLSGTFKLYGIMHKTDYSEDNKILEDKYFYVFKGSNIKGILKEEFPGGKKLLDQKRRYHQIGSAISQYYRYIKNHSK